MDKKVKWGILGLGNIAHKFANALSLLPDAQLLAVGSRTMNKSVDFGKEFNVLRTYGSYEDLLSDPDIEIIYVATPHRYHLENVLACLKSGKSVLCEKPFAMNENQASEMIQLARSSKLFLMEAMWTRFLPATIKLNEIIKSGKIGDIRLFKGDFAFRCDRDLEGRLLNPELAGGALFDAGIYPVSFATMLFGGQPEDISAISYFGETGVDEQTAITLRYPGGQMAQLYCGFNTTTFQDGDIVGTEGAIRLPDFFHASKMNIYIGRELDQTIELSYGENGFIYEAMEAMKCIREGKLESELMPLNETLEITRLMDNIKNQCGIKYSFDNA